MTLSLITFTRSLCMPLNTMIEFYLIRILSILVNFEGNKCKYAEAVVSQSHIILHM